MKIRLVFFIICVTFCQAFSQKTEYFPIRHDNLWGFIDTNGREVIKPQFHAVGIFSEGLAPARLKSTYGYIDASGQFVIKPQFDIAFNFENGLANVFIDAKPYVIDRKGNIQFEHNFKKIDPFKNRTYTIVETHSSKFGVVDLHGHLIIDTVFKSIRPFNNGLAVVSGFNDNPDSRDLDSKPVYETGVMDSLGNWIVRFGEYPFIWDFHQGSALVELCLRDDIAKDRTHKYDFENGFIDSKGILKFRIPSSATFFVRDRYCFNFSEGSAVVQGIHEKDSISEKSYYKGAINLKGQLIISQQDWEELTVFCNHRAFAKNYKWLLIDTNGKAVCEQQFEDILPNALERNSCNSNPFNDGKAVVKIEEGWCIIDTNGRMIVAPQKVEEIGNYYIIQDGNIIVQPESLYYLGIWNVNKGVLTKTVFNNIHFFKPNDVLIAAHLDNNLLVYVNQIGKIIWKETKSLPLKNKKEEVVNIDYIKEISHNLSVYEGLENVSKYGRTHDKEVTEKPTVILKTKEKNLFMSVFNSTQHVLYSFRGYFILEAKDKDGNWQNIERFSQGWVGCTFGDTGPRMDKDEIGEFDIPKFEGEFKTQLRAGFLYSKSSDTVMDSVVYSNEVEVNLNPSQLWYEKPFKREEWDTEQLKNSIYGSNIIE